MRRQNQKRVVLAKKPRSLHKPTRTTRVSRNLTIYQNLTHRHDQVKICVIRSLGGIGDILMTLPAVRQLKEDFPNCILAYATDRHSTQDYYELLKNVPFIDQIIDARYVDRNTYDAWVDISSVCIKYENASLPPLNRIDIFARACGIPRLKNPVPFYRIEPEESHWASQKISMLGKPGMKKVFLHTASFDKKRCWPPHRYEELITLAKSQRPDIHFLISDFNGVLPNKHSYTNCSDITDGSIRRIASLIDQCDLFVGPDSGPMHLAGALHKQSLVMFGNINPAARLNHYKSHTAILAVPKLSCQYCWYKACTNNNRCMTDITAQQVLQAITEQL